MYAKKYPIANVQCQYDSHSDAEAEERGGGTGGDHTYGRVGDLAEVSEVIDEPPAFLIQQTSKMRANTNVSTLVPIAPKIMTIAPGYPSLNLIQVAEHADPTPVMPYSTHQTHPEFNINKRIRRSEGVLRAAADCVSRGLTFQTVSEQFNIPISTIRFFMARKGILPRRRRGRSTQVVRMSSSPEPPFHLQHYKLPHMVALKADDEEKPE